MLPLAQESALLRLGTVSIGRDQDRRRCLDDPLDALRPGQGSAHEALAVTLDAAEAHAEAEAARPECPA